MPPEPERDGGRGPFDFTILRGFFARPQEVGAVAPSSKSLGREIVSAVEWRPDRAVVEAGPGNGAITRMLLERAPGEVRFLAVELNPEFAAEVRRRVPAARVCVGDLEHLPEICAREGVVDVGTVVATLPWAIQPPARQDALLDAVLDTLTDDGQLILFIYIHALGFPRVARFVRRLRRRFRAVSRSRPVLMNLPPAVVYACRAPIRPEAT